ncbi:cupin domain-containing protein [Candidatus Dojkabacteria bacterium]|nr:cupin domain-containing protein [Candidatus Dojkabacteria bacterium]
MTGFSVDIEQKTKDNNFFRQVLYTAQNMQLVIMSLLPNEEIGMEVHDDTDQFFRVESGTGKIVIDGEEIELKDGDVAIVPVGAEHNLINTSSSESLKLYTIYTPPHHPEKTAHKTKAEAMLAEEDEKK